MARYKVKEVDGKYVVYDSYDESGEPVSEHDSLDSAQNEAATKSYDEGFEAGTAKKHPEDNE